MTAITQKQVAILRALEGHEGTWMSREEMVPFAGKKGYSRALGASTRILRPDCLESRGLVRRLDDATPFRYQITPSGRVFLRTLGESGTELELTKHVERATPDARCLPLVRNAPLEVQTCTSSNAQPGKLAKLALELKKLIGVNEGVRPFVCSGDPLTCQVAIVGANPGTTTSFWPHWNDERGMSKEAFLEECRRLHGGRYGRSRAAIERFVPLVKGRVIELNAHGKHSRRLHDLAPEHRDTAVLEFVLRAVRPRVTLCAGADAVKAVMAINTDWQMKVIESPHFIYWGRHREHQMAQEINACLSGI